MREIRPSGSEGGETGIIRSSLPLSVVQRRAALSSQPVSAPLGLAQRWQELLFDA
jgi:hypothetical protein